MFVLIKLRAEESNKDVTENSPKKLGIITAPRGTTFTVQYMWKIVFLAIVECNASDSKVVSGIIPNDFSCPQIAELA